jgi:single-strand DNA-binding protein
MSGLNRVTLIGRLGGDPDQRFTAAGQAVVNFTMATSERWTDKDGNKQEKTEWHRIVVWGKLSEICGKYLGKGEMTCVEGRLQTREWDDKDGNKRKTTEIVASNVVLLGSSKDATHTEQQPAPRTESQPSPDAPPDDDYPF